MDMLNADGPDADDFGTNLSGWCRIKVREKSGATVRIMYSEKIDPVSKNIQLEGLLKW